MKSSSHNPRIGFLIVLSVFLYLSASAAETGRIEISVSGVAPIQGPIACALFSSKVGFPLESKKHAIEQVRVPASNGTATCIFESVIPGDYAVAVVHDTNDNKEADTNFFGIPTEGVGVSNNAMPKASFPKFDNCRFSVIGGQSAKQEIKLRY